MTAPVTPSERDVCALAGMVSEQRDDLPAQGLPMSLLSELKEQIPCDVISFEGFDSDRQLTWFAESMPGRAAPQEDPFETGLSCDLYRPKGYEHELMLSLPSGPGRPPGPGRSLRMFLFRGPGPDFSEADRALLTLLRPHLHHAYLDAERRRRPAPR